MGVLVDLMEKIQLRGPLQQFHTLFKEKQKYKCLSAMK